MINGENNVPIEKKQWKDFDTKKLTRVALICTVIAVI